MVVEDLYPNLDVVTEEYVLVQAWKKTASYIRYHNWYSDTLALDRTEVNLPHFLAELAEQMKSPERWRNDPLRIVPAPKSQHWHVVDSDGPRWEPDTGSDIERQLRPLAHVSLKDQVAATALMLCLADAVETRQGDPRKPVTSTRVRREVVSYGNRLFCEATEDELHHRWGSRKLYRAYFQDYQVFLARPGVVAAQTVAKGSSEDRNIVIVHSDLRQFYDRVRPELLSAKIDGLNMKDTDTRFRHLARRLLNWEWDKEDYQSAEEYGSRMDIPDFTRVALPQGLVAAGFFANVVLQDFDDALRESMGSEIGRAMGPQIRLEDICRYVDDLRIVLSAEVEADVVEIEQSVAEWLNRLLANHASGLRASNEKTRASVCGSDERPLVGQSRKMARIQSAVSGGFDAIGGTAILDGIQGLMRSQQRYAEDRIREDGWKLAPIPDVADATVARFAAGRYRNTYRSLRPLLDDDDGSLAVREDDLCETATERARHIRTQEDLDDDARTFALDLIEHWVKDPSNVRLLRIGLDLWPAVDVLRSVLDLLRPFVEDEGLPVAQKRVAWYCLSEVFRAGATETGFVQDDECLPKGVDISAYREVLREEAERLEFLAGLSMPWYLKQQVLLFLATCVQTQASIPRSGCRTEMTHLYYDLLQYLRGDGGSTTSADFVTLAIVSRRSFLTRKLATQFALREIDASSLSRIAVTDPAFAIEILDARPGLVDELSPQLRDDLCVSLDHSGDGLVSLSRAVLDGGPTGPLRNELALLRFADQFLKEWQKARWLHAITPSHVRLKLATKNVTVADVYSVQVDMSTSGGAESMYEPPAWCPPEDRWRLQLGYLLRFILTASQDFTNSVHPSCWKDGTIYRACDSHWYRRLYGLYNGQSAFGHDWLPITDWTEHLLSELLSWPGRMMSDWIPHSIKTTRESIRRRIRHLSAMQGRESKVLMLPVKTRRPVPSMTARPLRACVVQTVIPDSEDFRIKDLTLSDPVIRKRHRRHLSAALEAVKGMLALRETHKACEDRLDWLILPELSVHPDDVWTHLVPFARAYRTIILAGLTYEELFVGQPLVNSAIWVIPQLSPTGGLQVIIRRQGKCHLAPSEQRFNNRKRPVLQSFRPCQWIMGYEWSSTITHAEPLWLTASICYDATDLSLAADLRDWSDVFAIPALNKDVSTFDHMGQALHYHMFQMVIVANNGLYGGSNAYAPYNGEFTRQVFHLHGQPQASMAFVEIDDIAAFLNRAEPALATKRRKKDVKPVPPTFKSPPAGLSK